MVFCYQSYFYIKIRLKYEKNILLSSSKAFLLSTPALWKTARLHGKKATKCNKLVIPTGALVRYALFGMCDLKIKS